MAAAWSLALFREPTLWLMSPIEFFTWNILDAGGMLEVDTRDDKTSYTSLVGIINRRGMAPTVNK